MRDSLRPILVLLVVLALAGSAPAALQYTISDLNGVPGGPSAYGIGDFGLLWGQSCTGDPDQTAQIVVDGVLTDLNDLLMPGSGWDLVATFAVYDTTKQVVGAGDFGGTVMPFLLTPAGDADGNGRVDGGDMAIWQQNYSPLTAPDTGYWTADWNGDNRVDGGDLAIWQQNYCPLGLECHLELADLLGGDLDHCPEPTSLLLFVMGVAFSGRKIRQAFRRS